MSDQIVGYLINYKDRPPGDSGTVYDYVMAGNGIYIQSDNEYLEVSLPIVDCPIRGLAEEFTEVKLKHGKIPQSFFDLALTTLLEEREKETYLAITWDTRYHLFKPHQTGEPGKVEYQVLPNTVMDIHSHPDFGPRHSGTDDKDEQGLRLSLLVGNLDTGPHVIIRACAYGAFCEIAWNDVFDGTLNGAVEGYPVVVIDEGQPPTELILPAPNTVWWQKIMNQIRR